MSQKNTKYEVLYAEEAAVARAQGLIGWIMDQKGVSQKELAKRLGVSEAAISKMLGHAGGNVTVKRLARVLHVLGDKLEISSELRDAKTGKANNEWRVCAIHSPNELFTQFLNHELTSYKLGASNDELEVVEAQNDLSRETKLWKDIGPDLASSNRRARAREFA